LLAFFLNAAIDQQCEKYLAAGGSGAGRRGAGCGERGQWRRREKRGAVTIGNPIYSGDLPEGNNGLG
jgi:methylmalonyl-CoA mutase